MKTDDTRWCEYARVQRQLAYCPCADDRAAGFEKALHLLLSDTAQAKEIDLGVETKRACASAERNERRRRVTMQCAAGSLRDLERVHADACPVSAVHARIELTRIVRMAKPKELALVVQLAGGEEMQATDGVSRAAFRKRLERFRERLAA